MIKPFVLLVSLALAGGLGVLEKVSGSEFNFSIFYLLPIFLTVHYLGRWAGLFMSLVCGAIWFGVQHWRGKSDFDDLVFLWEGTARFGFFVIFTLLLASLEDALDREKEKNRTLETLLTLAPPDDRGWIPGDKPKPAPLATQAQYSEEPITPDPDAPSPGAPT